MKLSGNKILITGGASGIGLGLTERFLEEGNQVIICGRRREALEEVISRHPGVIARVCDLSDPEERTAMAGWISTEHADLNVLVNNAGIQQWMEIGDTDFCTRAEAEIDINILAPIHLTHLLLEKVSLDAILNVTSGLAFVPLTRVPVYSATKAFFHSFTLSLRHLLAGRGIEVIEMIPPALNTDLGGKGLHDAYPPVSDFVTAVFAQLAEGRTELTFGFSEMMLNAGPEALRGAFDRMNP